MSGHVGPRWSHVHRTSQVDFRATSAKTRYQSTLRRVPVGACSFTLAF